MDKHTLEIDSVELIIREREILTNVYLRIDTDKITALLGGNGSGKSSLMQILFGELKATHKSLRIDSQWRECFTAKEVLYLPQKCSLPNSIKVKRVFKDFDVCPSGFVDYFPELERLLERKVGDISSGERRIVEIYIILKADSKFVMLDEPFSQIMPLHISTIKALINEVKKSKGILLTDHMYKNVTDFADSIYVICNQTVYLTKSESDLVKYGYINWSG